MIKNSLFREEILPFTLLLSLLIFFTLIADFFLHQRNIVWVERYWGYIGSLFIALSFVYSLRKWKIIKFGPPKTFLQIHEYLAWIGGLMVLIHGGIHFNGLLAWLAIVAMFVTIASGLIGRVLLRRSKKLVSAKREGLLSAGMDSDMVDDELYWDTITVDLMKKWRSVHMPITAVFALLALLHIISACIFSL